LEDTQDSGKVEELETPTKGSSKVEDVESPQKTPLAQWDGDEDKKTKPSAVNEDLEPSVGSEPKKIQLNYADKESDASNSNCMRPSQTSTLTPNSTEGNTSPHRTPACEDNKTGTDTTERSREGKVRLVDIAKESLRGPHGNTTLTIKVPLKHWDPQATTARIPK
jgi:hypothetical protein